MKDFILNISIKLEKFKEKMSKILDHIYQESYFKDFDDKRKK